MQTKHLAAALLSSVLLFSGTANASVTFYNQSGEFVYVAIDWAESNELSCSYACSDHGYRYTGWWGIYPGNWATVLGRHWYELDSFGFHAEGTTLIWDDSTYRRCVTGDKHDECSPDFGSGSCSGGRWLAGYRQLRGAVNGQITCCAGGFLCGITLDSDHGIILTN